METIEDTWKYPEETGQYSNWWIFLSKSFETQASVWFTLCCYLFDCVSLCCSGWPRTQDVAQAGLKMIATILSQPPKPWDYRLESHAFTVRFLKRQVNNMNLATFSKPRQLWKGTKQISNNHIIVALGR